MVQPAVADVVGPAVPSVHPHGLLDEVLAVLPEVAAILVVRARGDARQGRYRLVGALPRPLGLVEPVEPRGQGILQGLVRAAGQERTRPHGQLLALLLDGEAHAKAELRVVLEERVGEGRPVSPAVGGVGDAGGGRAPGLSASRSVGQIHAVAEELRHQLHIGRLAASGAGAGELQQRLLELAPLH